MTEMVIFSDEFKEMLSMDIYGRSMLLALAGDQCVRCGKRAGEFRNVRIEKEYITSATCQRCQDKYWGGLPNP